MKKIGIKLADGTFHPLLEEGVPDKKKIELSTVKDNQTTVKVDLYASEKSTMADAILIDTLQIADLEKQPNGQPDINLALSMDKNGNIEATLVDSDSKTRARSEINLHEALLANDKNPGSGKGLLKTAEEINERDDSAEKKIAGELDDFNFDIPAFDEGAAPKTEVVEDEPKAKKNAPAETVVESAAADETVADDSFAEPPVEDVPLDEPIDESLDMPDFDVPAFEDSSAGDATVSDSAAADDKLSFDDNEFELPNFDESSSSGADDPFADDFDSSSGSGASSAAAGSSSSLDFEGLYDDEDDSRADKKTRLPVLVCMICAIICVLAVLLMLFIIPSRFNLINSRSSKTEVAQEKVSEPLPPPVQKEEPLPPPPAPAAKEDEIIVVEEADIVVPDLPKVEEKREPKVITYKIKWGDTLWDISAAYYKNPWRYKKIARYNGIKNPNHIVAGTYIKIPEE